MSDSNQIMLCIVDVQEKLFLAMPEGIRDDYIKNIKEWENKGGIGVHHTDVSKTLNELTKLGFK